MADNTDQTDKHDEITPDVRQRLETAASQLHRHVREGELLKMGAGWTHSFKTRWFVLNKDALIYFDKKGGSIKGGIMWNTTTGVRKATGNESKKPHSFVVETSTDRGAYVCACKSDEECDTWIESITDSWKGATTPSTSAAQPSEAGSKPSASTDDAVVIKACYWPTFGRVGAALRMLDEAQLPYERVTDVPGMAPFAGAFGAESTTFAPPIIVDGNATVAQSVAVASYIGRKCGFAPDVDESVALQYMLDIIDTFEGIYKEMQPATKLWTYLLGTGDGPSRFAKLASNVERQIKGPFYFGETPTYVDFFLSATADNLQAMFLDHVTKISGKNVLTPFSKISGVISKIKELPNQKDYTDKLEIQFQRFGQKPAYWDQFKMAGVPKGPQPDGFRVFPSATAKGGSALESKSTAVVFIEFQNEFTTEGGKLHDAVKGVMEETDMLKKAATVAESARKAGVKVFHAGIYFKEDASDNPNGGLGILNGCKDGQLFTEGTWNSEFHESMQPQEGDVVVDGKRGLDAFPGTNLEAKLKENGIETIALCGFLTNCCVESTMRTAYEKGFNVITLTDVCACTSPEGQKAAAGEGGTFSMFSKQMTADEFQTSL